MKTKHKSKSRKLKTVRTNPFKQEATKRIAAGDNTPFDLMILAIALEALETEFGMHNTTLEWSDETKEFLARMTSVQ